MAARKTFDTPWTEDLVNDLHRRWAQGQSSGEIAMALGFTRNAIIGKLKREGLIGQRKRAAAANPIPRKPRPSRAKARAETPAAPAPVVEEPIPFMARRAGQCAFITTPSNGLDAMCCGAPITRENTAYCDAHHARCYTAGTARRIKPPKAHDRAVVRVPYAETQPMELT